MGCFLSHDLQATFQVLVKQPLVEFWGRQSVPIPRQQIDQSLKVDGVSV